MNFLQTCIFKVSDGFLTINPLLLDKWDTFSLSHQHQILCEILRQAVDNPYSFSTNSLDSFFKKIEPQFCFVREVIKALVTGQYNAACDVCVNAFTNYSFKEAQVIIADLIFCQKIQPTQALFESLGRQAIVSANPLDHAIQLYRVAAWHDCPMAIVQWVLLVLNKQALWTSTDAECFFPPDSQQNARQPLEILLRRAAEAGVASADTQLGLFFFELKDTVLALQHWCKAAQAGCRTAVMRLADFFSDPNNNATLLQPQHYDCVGLLPSEHALKVRANYAASLYEMAAQGGVVSALFKKMSGTIANFQGRQRVSLLFSHRDLWPQLNSLLAKWTPLLLMLPSRNMPPHVLAFFLEHKRSLVDYAIENFGNFNRPRQSLLDQNTAFGLIVSKHRDFWGFGKTRSEKRIHQAFWSQSHTLNAECIELQPLQHSDF